MNTTTRTPFKAADIVKHTPSGEEWLLTTDEEDGRVYPAGWPESSAQATDCELVSASTDEKRRAMLATCATLGDDIRARVAKRQLSEGVTKSHLNLPVRIVPDRTIEALHKTLAAQTADTPYAEGYRHALEYAIRLLTGEDPGATTMFVPTPEPVTVKAGDFVWVKFPSGSTAPGSVDDYHGVLLVDFVDPVYHTRKVMFVSDPTIRILPLTPPEFPA